MKKIQVLSWILVTALATTQLAACGSSSSPSLTPESTTSGGSGASGTSPAVTSSVSLPDKKITIGLQVPAARFDPLQFPQEAIGGRSMGEMVYEPLLMSDGFGEVYPWLAESYEVNDDATEWIFYLREGVTFSNGEPMTAADVVCTFDRLLTNYSGMPASSYIQSIFPDNLFVSAEQVDDYTVKINLAYTFAISLLSFTDVMIIPDEAYAERGDDLFLDQSATGYYGTGPWVLQGHIIGQSANYKKNTNYWNKNYDSYYDEVEFLFITEQSTAIAACISGNIQAYCPSGGIRQDLISQFDSVRDKYDLYVTPQKSFFYMQLCTEAGKAFNDQKVRQAFLMSIDYESIIQYVFGGGTVMSQLIPDGFEGFNSDLPPYEYNPDEAKRLLAESGYDGRELVIYAASSTLLSEDQLIAICDYANAVGFNFKPQIVENAKLTEIRTAGEYDAFLAVGNLNDASPTVYLILRVRNDEHKHRLYDETLMSSITQGTVTVDKAQREEYYRAAMARMRELWGPLIGLYYADHYAAVGYGINGLELDIGGQMYFQFIDFNVDNPTSTEHGVDWEKLLM
jgi:ABC-type transport system substrate-binding protein